MIISSKLKIAVALLSLASVASYGTQISFPVTGSLDGKSLNASATITTNNGSIWIDVFNNQANVDSVIQLVSGVQFTLSGAGSTSAATLTSLAQPSRTVAGDGTFVDSTQLTGAHWTLDDGVGSTFFLNSLGSTGPAGLVIGQPTYSGGSIAGNGPHNPFFISGVRFTLAAPDVLSTTGIADATLFFGTTAGRTPGTSVPDGGATVALLGLALGALALIRRKITS